MSKQTSSKSKHAPATNEPKTPSRTNRIFWMLTFPLTVLAALAVGGLLIADLAKNERHSVPASMELAPGESTPVGWTYDAENDRHWDPTHNHWHDGPPPPSDQRAAVATPPPTDVEPWHYDEANDQHWDPGHNHWHKGPPPPPDQREVSTAPPSAPEIEPVPFPAPDADESETQPD